MAAAPRLPACGRVPGVSALRSIDPWIDDLYATALEIGSVPGCHGRTMRPGNSCDHGIQLRYRPARPVSCGHNCGEGASGILIRVRSFGELRGTPDSFTRREGEFDTAKRFDMPPDRFREIEPGKALRPQSGLQDFTRLLFHGPSVAGRPQAQLRLDRVIEASYGDARHTSMISLQSRDEFAGGSACGRS